MIIGVLILILLAGLALILAMSNSKFVTNENGNAIEDDPVREMISENTETIPARKMNEAEKYPHRKLNDVCSAGPSRNRASGNGIPGNRTLGFWFGNDFVL